MELSVIICTHEPRRDYLDRTIASLKEQRLNKNEWELILVDNASSAEKPVIADLSWHVNARLVREDKLGLTMARLRGISESRGALMVFVDDDNVLSPDYLEVVLDLSTKYSQLGVIGSGCIVPEFEQEPDKELKPYLPMLALREIERIHWSNDPTDNQIPWGAGMVVRRSVAERYLALILEDPMKQGLDRAGTMLNSCGDDEFSWVACGMGLGKGLFPQLKLVHLIGRSRVERSYLLRLAEGHAFSHALLDHMHGVRPKKGLPPPAVKSLIIKLMRLRLSEARWEARRLWGRKPKPSVTQRAFSEARSAGQLRFENFIASRNGH